ncbi:hypothetical protein ACFQ8W_00380 [Streptomyces sp. NPDC056508]|uniref:hypothetical protein n=1 Tax=Streptomyces sp. NPDC056508 TaxID=3345845 RepID=UPI00368576E2
MNALERARGYFDGISGTRHDSADEWVKLVAVVGALLNHLEEAGTSAPGVMTREAALNTAREHVEAMSTNTRGYQDGVKLTDKVAAVEAFARFLMGESE